MPRGKRSRAPGRVCGDPVASRAGRSPQGAGGCVERSDGVLLALAGLELDGGIASVCRSIARALDAELVTLDDDLARAADGR